MKSSNKLIAFLKSREGVKLKAYKDSAGNWTIGVGHKILPNEMGLVNTGITDAQATTLLQKDLAYTEYTINTEVKVLLNQNQFDAVVALVYNIGTGAFRKSALLRCLNMGFTDIAPYWEVYNKVRNSKGVPVVNGELAKQRKNELAIYKANTYKHAQTGKLIA